MSRIPNFGFSAFLKLINANDRPQRRILRERHSPAEGGYDYHKSLRRIVQRIAFEGLSLEQAFAAADTIRNAPERASARRGLERFFSWRATNSGPMSECAPMTFTSPRGLFKVTFQADFIVELNGRTIAVHIWNTQVPLVRNIVLAATRLVADRFPAERRLDDYAVLSLQDGSFFRWSESTAEHGRLGEHILTVLDRQCETTRFDLGLSLPTTPPSPPSPPTV